MTHNPLPQAKAYHAHCAVFCPPAFGIISPCSQAPLCFPNKQTKSLTQQASPTSEQAQATQRNKTTTPNSRELMTTGAPTTAAPHQLRHMPPVKADARQPHPQQDDDDDERRRATTAMAIVELLTTGGNGGRGPPPQAPPSNTIWLGNSYHNNPSTTNGNSHPASNISRPSNNSTMNNRSSDNTPSFPVLAALLPMKRPLWKTSGTPGAGPETYKTTHVHIQPLPSIAQLSKLAVSDRSSPTRIDAVTANNSAASASASPTLTPTATPPAVTPSTAAVSVNHSRKRQKDELDKLRVQVQELQRELDHVRGRLPKRPQGQYTVNGATGLPDMHASLPSSVTIWERIASHQKEQKNKSEMENMKLKAMVQEQVKISKALEKLVNKRCKNSVRIITYLACLFTCDMSHLSDTCACQQIAVARVQVCRQAAPRV